MPARMSDVNCPYCGSEEEICHDDGYGYEEDKAHEQQCSNCEKNIVFYTSISFSYEAEKADCLNGAPHVLEPVFHIPEYWKNWVRCKYCGYENKGEGDVK